MQETERKSSGIKRSQAWSTKRIKDMVSITVEILKTLYENWQSKASRDAGMLLAAASLYFFGFFRSGKLTIPMEGGYEADIHLGVQDITIDSLSNPQMLQVRLKFSKTDPFRVGVDWSRWQNQLPPLPGGSSLVLPCIPSRKTTDSGTLCDGSEDGSGFLRSGQYVLFGPQF